MLSILRRLPYFKLLPLLILASVLLGLSGYPLSAVQAQLHSNQPALAYASTVECIRAGADLGQPSHVSPRFATTCFGSRWSPGGYGDASVSDQGDAIRSDPAVLEFGDGKPDAPGEPGHLAVASLGEAGAVYGVAYSSGQNGAAMLSRPADTTATPARTADPPGRAARPARSGLRSRGRLGWWRYRHVQDRS